MDTQESNPERVPLGDDDSSAPNTQDDTDLDVVHLGSTAAPAVEDGQSAGTPVSTPLKPTVFSPAAGTAGRPFSVCSSLSGDDELSTSPRIIHPRAMHGVTRKRVRRRKFPVVLVQQEIYRGRDQKLRCRRQRPCSGATDPAVSAVTPVVSAAVHDASATVVMTSPTPAPRVSQSKPAPVTHAPDLTVTLTASAQRIEEALAHCRTTVLPVEPCTVATPLGFEPLDAGVACAGLGETLGIRLRGLGRDQAYRTCFSLQLTVVDRAHHPFVSVCIWVPSQPSALRVHLQGVNLPFLINALAGVPVGGSEAPFVEQFVGRVLSEFDLPAARLQTVTTQLGANLFGIYEVARVLDSGAVSLRTLVSPSSPYNSLTDFMPPEFSICVELLEDLHSLVRTDILLDRLLCVFGANLRSLPARESRGFLPHLYVTLTKLTPHEGAVAQLLRAGNVPQRVELANRLISAEFRASRDLLVTFLRPLVSPLVRLECPHDLRDIVAAVLDVINVLLTVLQGARTTRIPEVCWGGLFDHSGEVALPVVTQQHVPAVEQLDVTAFPGDVHRMYLKAALSLYQRWVRLWDCLLASHLCQGLLLPLSAVSTVLRRKQSIAAWAGLSGIDSEALLRQINALDQRDAHLGLTLRDCWERQEFTTAEPLGRALAPALVIYRYVQVKFSSACPPVISFYI